MQKEQFIHVDGSGAKRYYSNPEMTILHREDGPAIENADGYKEWWFNGELHREDGPAVERVDWGKSWWLNGKLHREDGPAIEHADGCREWYINGKHHTEEKFNARMDPVEITLDEIADKFGVSVEQLKIKK